MSQQTRRVFEKHFRKLSKSSVASFAGICEKDGDTHVVMSGAPENLTYLTASLLAGLSSPFDDVPGESADDFIGLVCDLAKKMKEEKSLTNVVRIFTDIEP